PVKDGEVGEVVITSLNRDYPLIRFATGDLSAVLAGARPCGGTQKRIKRGVGGARPNTKERRVVGTPPPNQQGGERRPHEVRARVVIEGETGNDKMTLKCEAKERPGGLAEAIVASIRELTKLRGEVELVPPGALPNDGKVIEDARKYT